jgi:hypothetical protein
MQDDRNIVIYKPDGTSIWASNTPYVPGVEVPVDINEEVGWGKFVQVQGKLYRSGEWFADVYTRNGNLTSGLRARVLVVVVDEGGHMIWVSKERVEPTRCALPDPLCASYGQTTWQETFPAAIGRYAYRCDIYAADTPVHTDLDEIRKRLIDLIRAGVDVAGEVKAAWAELVA